MLLGWVVVPVVATVVLSELAETILGMMFANLWSSPVPLMFT